MKNYTKLSAVIFMGFMGFALFSVSKIATISANEGIDSAIETSGQDTSFGTENNSIETGGQDTTFGTENNSIERSGQDTTFGTTPENTDNNGGGNNSTNNDGSSKKGGKKNIVSAKSTFEIGGAGNAEIFTSIFSNISFEKVGQNSMKISWNTQNESFGRIVFGTVSIPNPVSNDSFLGYQNGSPLSKESSLSHSAVAFLTPGFTYYFRPIAVDIDGNVFLGEEISITPVALSLGGELVGVNSGSINNTSGNQDSNSSDNGTESENASTTNTGENMRAGVVWSVGSHIKGVFTNLWNILFGKVVCE